MGKKFLSLAVFILFVFALIPNGNALYTDQKSIMLDVEQGESVRFYVYMEGTGSSEISHLGDMPESWISHPTYTNTGEWLEITIDVPSDAEIRNYNEVLKADGIVTTKLTMFVNVPLEEKFTAIQNKLSIVEGNQGDMEGKVDDVIEELGVLDGTMADLWSEVSEVKGNQISATEMESQFSAETQALQSRIEGLESERADLEYENKQLNDLTGMVGMNSSTIGFLIGAVVGILAAVLYFRILPNIGGFSGGHGGKVSGASGIVKAVKVSASAPSSKRIRNRSEFRYDYRKR